MPDLSVVMCIAIRLPLPCIVIVLCCIDLYRYPEVSEDLTGHMSGVRDGEFRVWKYICNVEKEQIFIKIQCC